MRQGTGLGGCRRRTIMEAIRKARRERKGSGGKKRSALQRPSSRCQQQSRKSGRRKSPTPNATNPDGPLDSSKQSHGCAQMPSQMRLKEWRGFAQKSGTNSPHVKKRALRKSGTDSPKGLARIRPTGLVRIRPTPVARIRPKAWHGFAQRQKKEWHGFA